MTTGERIRMVRKAHNMNQTDFAKEIAVSTTTVCQLEIGKYNISRTTKHVLCRRFNINPDWLDTGEGEMYAKRDNPEALVPAFVDILNDNRELLRALRIASETFTAEDWKKLNQFVKSLGETNDDGCKNDDWRED